MILYLFKMIACSTAFYALYHFFFSKEKMLQFNRFYLQLGLVASFIIPLISFTIYVPASSMLVINYDAQQIVVVKPVTEYSIKDYAHLTAIALISVGTALMLLRFAGNLWRLTRSVKQNETISLNHAKLVLLKQDVLPYSFLNNIFVSKADYEQGRVEEAVIAHELAHIRQKHSWDILFVEFLQIFTWFNPMILYYKKAVKINHEFLADEAVVRQTQDRSHYQQLLLQMVYVNNNIPLASSFYFFTTKKRILMLQKTFKRKRTVWAGMATVPLLALLVYSLSSKVYATINEPKNQSVVTNSSLSGKPLITSGTSANDTIPTKAATAKEMKEYEVIIKEMTVIRDGKKRGYKYIEGKTQRAVEIHGRMSDEQISKASALPPPPPPPRSGISTKDTISTRPGTGKEMKDYEDIMKEMAVKKNGRTYYKFIEDKMQKAAEIYRRMSAEQRRNATPLPPPPPPPPPPGIKSDVSPGGNSITTTYKGLSDEMESLTVTFR